MSKSSRNEGSFMYKGLENGCSGGKLSSGLKTFLDFSSLLPFLLLSKGDFCLFFSLVEVFSFSFGTELLASTPMFSFSARPPSQISSKS
jgi:hypothetical protein